jgi:hypothetical protein|tara:strand:+ start:7052 stop:7333 length:282 start_codon:yes stop_codon:yes gene_type:complete
MIDCYYKTTVDASSIHCQGRFTNEPIEQGKLVLRINGNIYKNENNSFVNHSTNNNIDWNGNNGWISNRFISVGEELTMNYNQWIDISHLGWNA